MLATDNNNNNIAKLPSKKERKKKVVRNNTRNVNVPMQMCGEAGGDGGRDRWYKGNEKLSYILSALSNSVSLIR